MRNNCKKITLLLVFTTSLHAYEFSFFNKTQDPVAIAIQFSDGTNEPLYKQYVKPGSMINFVPGKYEIPDIKWSFCLKNIYYAKNPTMEQRVKNFAKTVWKKVPITWTTSQLETAKKPKLLPKTKKMTDSTRRLVMKKTDAKLEEKSLCKDRHFEITEDEHGKVIVTGSLVE